MTVNVQNTEVTSTFDFWRNRTNELAYAMSNKAITVESAKAVGNGGIIGTFTANNIVTEVFTVNNYISVGNSTVNTVIDAKNITFTNSTFTSTINSTSGSFSSYISIGSAVANATVNTSVIKLSNSTSNTYISIPSSEQFSNGSYFLNANGNWAVVQSPVTSEAKSFTGTGTQVFDSFLKANFRSAEYLVSTTNLAANGYEVTKLLVIHDNGDAYLSEYGTITTNNHLCVFTVGCNTTHAIVYNTPNSTSMSIKYTRALL